MKPKIPLRALLVAALLLAAVAVVGVSSAPTEEPSSVRATAAGTKSNVRELNPRAPRAVTATPSDSIDLPAIGSAAARRTPFEPAADAFERRSWQPPPPPPSTMSAPPASAPAPSPPPFPYRYVGQEASAGKTVVFLMRGEDVVIAAPGETIDGMYRVDAVAAGSITFTYIPLNMQHELRIGDNP